MFYAAIYPNRYNKSQCFVGTIFAKRETLISHTEHLTPLVIVFAETREDMNGAIKSVLRDMPKGKA